LHDDGGKNKAAETSERLFEYSKNTEMWFVKYSVLICTCHASVATLQTHSKFFFFYAALPCKRLRPPLPAPRAEFMSSHILKSHLAAWPTSSFSPPPHPMTSQPPSTQRVAIVGSGIAGLTAAWLLSRDSTFQVTLIESEPSLGMDAHSFDMAQALPDGSAGSTQRLDMPLRVFSESYYPNLTRLYSAAGVTFCPEDYCGSFLDTDGSCLFKYSNLLIGPYSLPWIFPRFLFKRASLSLALEYFRFMVVARRHTKDGSLWLKALETMTFGEYLQRGKYSAAFINKFMVHPQVVTNYSFNFHPLPIVFSADASRHVTTPTRSQFPAQSAPAAPPPSSHTPPTSSSPTSASAPCVACDVLFRARLTLSRRSHSAFTTSAALLQLLQCDRATAMRSPRFNCAALVSG
jgi:hypothetical protein